MSEMEMVNSFIQLNGVKRFDGYTGTPKLDRRIILNAGSNKRERKHNLNRLEKFGKYIERNY